MSNTSETTAPRRGRERKPPGEGPSQRRRDQNRSAQLAFRHRREELFNSLEERCRTLEYALKQSRDGYERLQGHTERLEDEVNFYRTRYPQHERDGELATYHESIRGSALAAADDGQTSMEAANDLLAVSQSGRYDRESRSDPLGHYHSSGGLGMHSPAPDAYNGSSAGLYPSQDNLSGSDEGLLPGASTKRRAHQAGLSHYSGKRHDLRTPDLSASLSGNTSTASPAANPNLDPSLESQEPITGGLPFLYAVMKHARFTEVDVDELGDDGRTQAICKRDGTILQYEMDKTVDNHVKWARPRGSTHK